MAHADINICCELLRMCFFLQMARVSRRIKTPPNPQGISLEKNLIFLSTLIYHKKMKSAILIVALIVAAGNLNFSFKFSKNFKKKINFRMCQPS